MEWCQNRIFLVLLTVLVLASPPIGAQSLPFDFEAILALDYVEYDSRNIRDSAFRYDRAIIRLEGDIASQLLWRVSGDLRGIDTRYGLEEAWLSLQSSDHARLTLGLMKIAGGVEYTIPEEELSFIGYAFPAYLDGRTDVGASLDGEFAEGFFFYELAATLGAGFDRNGQDRNEPLLALRLLSYPFRSTERLSGIFVGASYSHMTSYEGELDVSTPLRNKLFDAPELDADESSFFHISWGADAGPVRFLHEFGRGSLIGLQLTDGTETDLEDQVTAWAGSISWMLTGEHYDTRPFRQRYGRSDAFPAKPLFGDMGGSTGIGALELAFRYANGDIDREFFNLGFTDYSESSQEFRSATGAINWYPAKDLRLSFQVVRTIADQAPRAFDSDGRDTSYVLRGQFQF